MRQPQEDDKSPPPEQLLPLKKNRLSDEKKDHGTIFCFAAGMLSL